MINLQYSTIQTPLPKFIHDDIDAFCAASNNYHFQPSILITKLALIHKLPENFIHLSAGSDESIFAFTRAYGKTTSIFTPTYSEYEGKHNGVEKLTEIWSEVNGTYVINSAMQQGSSLIFLANPNNPFGYTPQHKIVELIKNNPKSMVVIDEAYSKFFHETMISHVQNYDNLAVLRSFSKDYAMAGCRIGYVIAHPGTLNRIKRHIQQVNVSYISVGAALSALNHESYFNDLIASVKQTKTDFCNFLTRHDFAFLESSINAVLLHFETVDAGKAFYDYLQQCGVNTSLGNGNSNIGLDDSYLRITIGTPKQMNSVKKYIAAYAP